MKHIKNIFKVGLGACLVAALTLVGIAVFAEKYNEEYLGLVAAGILYSSLLLGSGLIWVVEKGKKNGDTRKK